MDPRKSGIDALSNALTKATDEMEEVWRLFLRANDTRHEKPLAPQGIVTPESLRRIYSEAEKIAWIIDLMKHRLP